MFEYGWFLAIFVYLSLSLYKYIHVYTYQVLKDIMKLMQDLGRVKRRKERDGTCYEPWLETLLTKCTASANEFLASPEGGDAEEHAEHLPMCTEALAIPSSWQNPFEADADGQKCCEIPDFIKEGHKTVMVQGRRTVICTSNAVVRVDSEESEPSDDEDIC